LLDDITNIDFPVYYFPQITATPTVTSIQCTQTTPNLSSLLSSNTTVTTICGNTVISADVIKQTCRNSIAQAIALTVDYYRTPTGTADTLLFTFAPYGQTISGRVFHDCDSSCTFDANYQDIQVLL